MASSRFGWHSGVATAKSYELNKNSYPDYGLKMETYKGVKKADIKMTNDVVMLSGAGTPTNGTTGDTFAGPGSMYIDRTNKDLYINTGTKSASVWKKVTRAT